MREEERRGCESRVPASGAGDRSVGREMRNDCELNWYETQIEFSHWRRGAAWAAVGPAAQVPFSSLALRSSYENEEAISLPLLVIAQSRDSNARTDNDGDDDEQPPAAAGEGGRLGCWMEGGLRPPRGGR